jgi:hypothetical protein
MSSDDESHMSFEEMLRSMAAEVSRSLDDQLAQADIEGAAEAFGLDPDAARGWVDTAGDWLRAQVEHMGEAMPTPGALSRERAVEVDPLSHAGPHPLDVPTDDQGLALAALDSGRWSVEPGTEALAARGEGPGPSDALGLVRELRTRDWINGDGEVTLVGRHALSCWLDAAKSR